MNRGEVWWADVPGADRRPYLILTRNQAIPLLSRVLAVPSTRTTRGLPTEVPLGPDDGMPTECVLTLDNVEVLRKARFVSRICVLPHERMEEVCTALSRAVDCS